MAASRSGILFAISFLAFSSWCVISFLIGEDQALYAIAFATYPFSLVIGLAGGTLHSRFGVSFEIINWFNVVLDVVCGMTECYFIGWILGRPSKHWPYK